MTGAFAAADEVIFATFGVGATWKAGGNGPGVACTVVRERPTADAGAFGSTMLRDAQVISLRAAEVAAPAKGDTITIGAEVLTVRAVRQDSLSLVFVCECSDA